MVTSASVSDTTLVDPTDNNPITVALVEDDDASREGLTILIDGTDGYQCVGTWGSVEDALAARLSIPPQVLLLDINLPGMSGSDGVYPLRERWPDTTVVMLTSFADDANVFRSICNGACGYLLKKTPPARLLDAIGEAANGGAPMSPSVARRVVQFFRKTTPLAHETVDLTPKEVDLLGLLANGHSYESAGRVMHVSINTVRNYVRSVYDKLHVHSKSEAVSKALRAGII